MVKRARAQKRSGQTSQEGRDSWLNSRLVRWSVLWSVAVLVTLVIIRSMDLRLGQGSFAYRFSPIYAVRFIGALPMLVVGSGFLASLHLLAHRRQRLGLAAFALAGSLTAVWAWWAPPSALRQHMVNLVSPAHDGAFVFERFNEIPQGASLVVYLQRFNTAALSRSVEDMRGTRVLSNPPGMTILATWVHRLWPPQLDPPGLIERSLGAIPSERERLLLAEGIRLGIVLHVLWAMSLIPAYAVARLYLPPTGASVAAILMWLAPNTLLFTPGKDPAQLLTVLTMTWAILASYRSAARGRAVMLAALAGVVLVIGTMLGLIHLWVAAAIGVALLWDALQSDEAGAFGGFMLRQALPAACGALALILIVGVATDWNIPATAVAVFRRFRAIQPGLALDHRLWMLIGLPIFLLFMSAAMFAIFMLNARRLRRGGGFGRRLLISTMGIMAITYLIGVPYELPRLWVVFLPLLVLGMTIDLPMFHAERSPRRAVPALSILLIVHLLFLIAHFSLMDVRESEYRMTTHRLWY